MTQQDIDWKSLLQLTKIVNSRELSHGCVSKDSYTLINSLTVIAYILVFWHHITAQSHTKRFRYWILHHKTPLNTLKPRNSRYIIRKLLQFCRSDRLYCLQICLLWQLSVFSTRLPVKLKRRLRVAAPNRIQIISSSSLCMLRCEMKAE